MAELRTGKGEAAADGSAGSPRTRPPSKRGRAQLQDEGRKGRPRQQQFIDPEELRGLVASAQRLSRCGDRLAEFLMRIHDIVHVKHEVFRRLSADDWEECRGYSLFRWMKKGIYRIDLDKYANPFYYFARGTYLNMLHRLADLRKDQERRREFREAALAAAREAFPGLQLKDLEAANDAF